MSEANISIEKLAFGGSGFGRLAGKACFVPYTAPGDMARIRIKSEKKSYIEAELVELLTPSQQRVDPPCPVFGICGGCAWQHISYIEQLAAKQNIFTDLLWRSGRVENHKILPIIASPETYHYRSRIQLKLHYCAGHLNMGFYRAGSHYVIDMPPMCAIANSALNLLIDQLRCYMDRFPEPHKIPQIDLASGDDGKTHVVFHYIGDNYASIEKFTSDNNCLLPNADGVFIQSGRKSSLHRISGEERLYYGVEDFPKYGLRLGFSGGGFSQVNYRQNLTLLSLVRQWTELTGQERILDLYCGNGNFSLPLAQHASEIKGVEGFGPSILDAIHNSSRFDTKNACYTNCDAKEAINRFINAKEQFDVIILDPPRSGASEIADQLCKLHPRKIVYVSCDPATLARDLGTLRKTGYELVQSCPVDMFPQTYHIESVSLLTPIGTTK